MKEDGLGLAALETGVSQERKCITLCYLLLPNTTQEWWPHYSWKKRQPVSSNEASDKTV